MRSTIFVMALCAFAAVTMAEDTTTASDVTDPNENQETIACTNITAKVLCNDEETCTWDDDDNICGTAAGGGGGVPVITDAPTTTSSEAGVGGGGDNCGFAANEASCVADGDCEWEEITENCNAKGGGNGGGSSETTCPDITNEAACGTQAGCLWLSDSSSCETDNDANEGAQCTEYDPVQRRCQAIEAKAACIEACMWDDRGGTCAKDDEYDPNSCADQDTQNKCNALAPGNDNVQGSGCEWVDDACGKVEEETGAGGSETTSCGSIRNEADCEAEGQTDDDASGSSSLVSCEWVILGTGGPVSCFNFESEGDCEAAKDESDEKACEWFEPTDDGTDDGAVANDDDVNQGTADQNCREYDACGAITTGADDCAANFECIFKNNVCRKMGPGDATGCPAQEDKDTCEAFTGTTLVEGGNDDANPVGDDGDDDGNPACLWKEEDVTTCNTMDKCADKNKNRCQPSGDLECAWDDFLSVCADDALVIFPACGESTNSADEDACTAVKDDKGAAACMWNVRAATQCIDFEYCIYTAEAACTAADDAPGCWWDGRFCNVGVEPTYTTITTATLTTTTSTTVTTLFTCTAGNRMCDSKDECVRQQYWCDGGNPDCDDGSDEKDCSTVTTTKKPVTCKIGSAACADPTVGGAACYLEAWACDGQNDCQDGTDEKNCPSTKVPVPKSTTATTGTLTSATTTTTRTTTKTTTTAPNCVRSKDCLTMDTFDDAANMNPLYSTPAKCRACVQNRDIAEVCEDAPTVGCPGASPPSNEATQAQLDAAFEAKTLRVGLPFGVSEVDVEAVLFQRLPELACKGKPASCMTDVARGLLAVKLEPLDNSDFMAVVCYVTKISGVWVQIGEMAAETPIDVFGKVVLVYNSKLVNVDAEDGPKEKVPPGGGEFVIDDFDPELAVGDYYFPTFDGFNAVSQADLETIALGFGLVAASYGSTAELKTAVMVENAKRIVADQMGEKRYIAPSAIGSTSNADVQAIFAAALGLDTVGVPKSGVMAMLQDSNEQLMDDAARLAAATGNDKKHPSAGKKSGGGKTVGVVVLILIVIGVAGGFAMFIHKKRQASAPSHKKMSNYENGKGSGGSKIGNPAFARGTPSWADPAVPFLSRSEAEAALKKGGSQAKSFVVRQADSTPEGYIITSINAGVFSNIQLKRQNGQLCYGPKPLGANLNEAVLSLQNKVPIAPKGAPQYFLGQQVNGGSVNIGMDEEEAAC